MKKLLFVLLLSGMASCAGRTVSTTTESLSDGPTAVLVGEQPVVTVREIYQPPLPPAHLEGEAQRLWLRDHFWDRFDFRDSTFVARLDSVALQEAYTFYLARVIGPNDAAAMARLMDSAAGCCPTLDCFSRLAERWLHDPNSPLRSDELYIPVLRARLQSPCLSEVEQARPAHQLRLALQNRVGEQANDFLYTLPSGAGHRLYDLRADYTLLFINNPGCPMCRDVQEALQSSPMLSQLIERGSLRVLMIYPDEDLETWRNHAAEVPASWINAYDKGCRMREELLYDLKAIPALYLLDHQKRVLLKDVVDVSLVEYTIDHQ